MALLLLNREGLSNACTGYWPTQARGGGFGRVAIALHKCRSYISIGSSMDMEDVIKQSLVALLGAIKNADGDAVSVQMTRLEGYLDEGRGKLHPQLVHFLERRSYNKALLFLGGESDIPAGSCGGRT